MRGVWKYCSYVLVDVFETTFFGGRSESWLLCLWVVETNILCRRCLCWGSLLSYPSPYRAVSLKISQMKRSEWALGIVSEAIIRKLPAMKFALFIALTCIWHHHQPTFSEAVGRNIVLWEGQRVIISTVHFKNHRSYSIYVKYVIWRLRFSSIRDTCDGPRYLPSPTHQFDAWLRLYFTSWWVAVLMYNWISCDVD